MVINPQELRPLTLELKYTAGSIEDSKILTAVICG